MPIWRNKLKDPQPSPREKERNVSLGSSSRNWNYLIQRTIKEAPPPSSTDGTSKLRHPRWEPHLNVLLLSLIFSVSLPSSSSFAPLIIFISESPCWIASSSDCRLPDKKGKEEEWSLFDSHELKWFTDFTNSSLPPFNTLLGCLCTSYSCCVVLPLLRLLFLLLLYSSCTKWRPFISPRITNFIVTESDTGFKKSNLIDGEGTFLSL